MAIAGRILIIPKGDYTAHTQYEMLDLVNHNGMSWLAKKSVKGVEPSDGNVEYWHKMFHITPESIVGLDEYIDNRISIYFENKS